MSSPASKPEPPKSPFFVEIWGESRRIFKELMRDVLLFLTIQLVLFLAHVFFTIMEHTGYPKARIDVFEAFHFWTYFIVSVLFAIDLFCKLVAFFIRKQS